MFQEKVFNIHLSDGESTGRTLFGFTAIGAAHEVLYDLLGGEEGARSVVAVVPAATAQKGIIALLAFRADGTMEDTGYRLHELRSQ